MIPSESADVVFSFDSLVHADQSVIESYLSQLPRILKPNGVVFLHHSNLAQYGSENKTPKLLVKFKYFRKFLDLIGWRPFDLHMRDWSVSAAEVASYAKKVGLSCVSQEYLRWTDNRCYIDCISVFLRSKNPHSKSFTRYFNESEEHDRRVANALARMYLAKP